MENLALNWECTDFSHSIKNGVAIFEVQGNYDQIKASFTLRMDENGILEIDYSARLHKQKKTLQEAGIKFLTGDSMEKISWKRDPYFTSYPDSHPGRAIGESRLSYQPDSYYRIEPAHGWEHDTRGFYYFGLEAKLAYSNEVRSLKERIYEYALSTTTNNELRVYSKGDQACRFDRIQGKNTLLIHDQWDYNSLLWGNYMKRIPLPKKLNGQVILTLSKTL
jgi:hypothetical protein